MGSTVAYRMRLISDRGELEQILPDWMNLLENSRTNELMLTPDWLLTWWKVFGKSDGRELAVGALYEGRELIALAPWIRRKHSYRGRLRFRRIEPLGTGEDQEHEICSDYTNVIVRTEAEEVAGKAMAHALAEQKFGNWDELVLPMAEGEDPTIKVLTRELNELGIPTRAEKVNEAVYIPLPRTWDDYLGALSSSRRYYLNRTLRDFERWAAGEYEIKVAASAEELELGKRRLVELHQHRWESQGYEGAFSSSIFTEFHESLMPVLLRKNALQLMWLSVRGEPIAALYNILYGGKVYFYQSGRRVDLPKGIRPGAVIQAHAIRLAIEHGMREYDFLAGPSQFKLKLGLASRSLVRIRAAKRSLVEYARAVAEGGIAQTRAARRMFKNLSQTRPAADRVADR